MLANLLILTVFLVVGWFMATRIYLLINRKELNVRGAVYSKASTPVRYAITLACAVLGTLFCFGMATVMCMGIIQGW